MDPFLTPRFHRTPRKPFGGSEEWILQVLESWHAPFTVCWRITPCNKWVVLHDEWNGWHLYLSPQALGIAIMKMNTSFLSRIAWGRDPEVCGGKRVRDLTGRITKTHAYPAAYGGFSDVWSCHLTYRDKSKPPMRVAVKAIRPVFASSQELHIKQKAVEQERDVWAGLKHPNVLPLLGITSGFGQFLTFVCPWADNGTLSEYLEKFEPILDLKRRLTLLADIAAGLQYLHGDLSGSNVLITKTGRACLSDFGLSTLVEVSDTSIAGVTFAGNIRWAAPELFRGCTEETPTSQLSSPQADIYSFGSVMLQTLTGKLPFHGVQRVAQIVIMISRGRQPPREDGWNGLAIPDVLWKFVEACWALDPSERPSCKEIIHFIKRQRSRM